MSWRVNNLLAARVLTIVVGKGGKSRRVHLSASLAFALNRRKECATGDRVLAFSPMRARACLRVLARTTRVAYKGVHALRHYAGTRLAQETGDLEHVARHLGHHSLEMAHDHSIVFLCHICPVWKATSTGCSIH